MFIWSIESYYPHGGLGLEWGKFLPAGSMCKHKYIALNLLFWGFLVYWPAEHPIATTEGHRFDPKKEYGRAAPVSGDLPLEVWQTECADLAFADGVPRGTRVSAHKWPPSADGIEHRGLQHIGYRYPPEYIDGAMNEEVVV